MVSNLKLAWLWFMLGGLMLILVAILSLIPSPDTGVNDKFAHLLIYGILSGWFCSLINRRSHLLWVAAGLIAYGGFIELLQSLTADRYAEWGDLLANTLGISLGLIIYFTPLPRLLRFIDSRLAGLRQ